MKTVLYYIKRRGEFPEQDYADWSAFDTIVQTVPIDAPTPTEQTMPTYSYRCEQCGKTFERNEAMSAHEAARPKCPKCDSTSVHQVMTPFFAKTSKKS